jgi:hypothetical protein
MAPDLAGLAVEGHVDGGAHDDHRLTGFVDGVGGEHPLAVRHASFLGVECRGGHITAGRTVVFRAWSRRVGCVLRAEVCLSPA